MHTAASEYLCEVDNTLGRLIKQVGPCELRPRWNSASRAPYMSLVEAIAHQQLTAKAANSILTRFKALFPRQSFPTPRQLLELPDGQLRAVGFSRAKAVALKSIAAKTLEGIVPSARRIARMEDAAIVERLTAIRGVGQWTVEMLLIFQLGRTDVLPVNDYGVRKGFASVFGMKELPKPRELLSYGERWRPYRSIAAWYLWRAIDLDRARKAKPI
jgi:DNA-3-methyladenine glycosylase II